MKTAETLATKVKKKNPGRASEIGAKFGCAAVFMNPKTAKSTIPDVLKFCVTGKGLFFGTLEEIQRENFF